MTRCIQAEACLWSKAFVTAVRDCLFLLRVYRECLTSRTGLRSHLVKERVAWDSVCHRDNRTWVLYAFLCQIILGIKPGKQLLSTKITKSRFPTEKQRRLALTIRQNSHTRLNYETPNPMACPSVNVFCRSLHHPSLVLNFHMSQINWTQKALRVTGLLQLSDA